MPEFRTGLLFRDRRLKRRTRAEWDLTTVSATCYLKGAYTRRMNSVIASLTINNLSKSQVSDKAQAVDSMVEDFRTRSLEAEPCLYLLCDVLTMHVREGVRVLKTSVLLASRGNAEGPDPLAVETMQRQQGSGASRSGAAPKRNRPEPVPVS